MVVGKNIRIDGKRILSGCYFAIIQSFSVL